LTILITEDGPQPSFYYDCNFNSAFMISKQYIIIIGFFSQPIIKWGKKISHCRNSSNIQ